MATARPDLAALDLLVRVAEGGSLGAAARSVGVAQPNASRSITRLERQLGLALLTRGPTGSDLTTEGSVVVEWAREALAGVDRLVTGARSLATADRPHLMVAASFTIAEYLAPAWLSRFRQAHPELMVSLAVGNSEQVLRQVSSREVPLGFIETPIMRRGVHSATVARDELVVVVGPGHPWAGRGRRLRLEELASASLVVREAGSGTRETFVHALARAGMAPAESSLELASTAAVKAAASSGDGPAVLSRLAVASELAAGTLIEVPVVGLDMSRLLRAVWPTGTRLDAPASALVRLAAGRKPAG